MDTPKHQVSWLENFPPDIWAYFAAYLPGEQLVRLSMTGATFLRQRLRSPHVVKFIKLGKDSMIPKSFPRLFNDFPSLEELSIDSHSCHWSTRLSLKIDLIPSGVRKLELSGDWKDPADRLFGGRRYNSATLRLKKYLPHLESLDLYTLPFKRYSWIRHSPPSLTKLRIRSWHGDVELPTSLIHFEADMVFLSEDSFVFQLPPSLESFVAKTLIGDKLLVPVLPPSIRTLSVSSGADHPAPRIFDRFVLAELPKSLTCLELPEAGIDFGTNPELISLLPSTLTKLQSAQPIPCSVWHLLPQPLTTLSFPARSIISTVTCKVTDSDGVHHKVKSIPFDYFPRSITSLKLDQYKFDSCFCGPPTIPSNQSYFPPQLTRLELTNIQLSPETAKLLPSSLTYLRIANLCARVCKHLSDTLILLEASPALVTPELIKHLPKSLTSLFLAPVRPDERWFDYNTGKKISVTKLPEFSIQEYCLSRWFDWEDHPRLPATLTRLSLFGVDELGDNFLLHHQPKLIELNMHQPKHFTDLSIPLLPYLTSLDLISSSKVSGKSFRFLSRSLTCLDLDTSKSIFDCDIQHLPRTLKYAFLSNAVNLTDLCIPDLPPGLEILDLRHNSKISIACFPALPYSLRSAQFADSALFASWRVSWGVLKRRNRRLD